MTNRFETEIPLLLSEPAPEPSTETFTVQEAARRTGMSEHTLRYYERVALITPVARTGSGAHRRYTENDLRFIEFLKRLRSTGMPIKEMQQYVRIYREGDHTLEARCQILESHRQRICASIGELQTHLAVIEAKIRNYKRLGIERDGQTDIGEICDGRKSTDQESEKG